MCHHNQHVTKKHCSGMACTVGGACYARLRVCIWCSQFPQTPVPQGKQLCVVLNKTDLLQRGPAGQPSGSPEQQQQIRELHQELQELQRECASSAGGAAGAGTGVQLSVLQTSSEKGYGVQQLLEWLVAGSQEQVQVQKAAGAQQVAGQQQVQPSGCMPCRTMTRGAPQYQQQQQQQ